ncbi:PREDICTED: high mobility group B protein 9-like [Nicotiana attenuata]|uniref:High mobility group b protein 9 n=1 Tax=Nicotiana attenuata TaxID=49451 RepID=A0A1J6IUE6_NICAT|nr:PREDICTED: high mobility group B protein 9-like [Nicotiana attenuata]OIT08470.1 high mobility group b protein 9 [Nicotiana attenuata]
MNKLSLCQKFNVLCLCPLRFKSREKEEEEEAKVRKLSLHITVASTRVSKTPSFYCLLKLQLAECVISRRRQGESMSQKAMVPAGAGNRNGGQLYPPPVASHENIVNDSTLFKECLKNFHSLMGTKYTVPVIGGKELDLHVLYVEVTKRGGFDKVVDEKKWREVSSVFKFSPTTTSASYALRKHYFTLLHRFEQLYFFRREAPLLDKTPVSQSFQAEGTIDGKFDCGYLVSIKMGSEVLNGVLYHPNQPAAPSSSKATAQNCTAIVPYNPPPHQHSGRRNRRRKGGDPNRPKPNRSGYNFFFAEKHSMLKSLYPSREREFTKMIGESWNNLSPEEKMVYQNYGVKDKERYQKEMKEYKERMQITSCY